MFVDKMNTSLSLSRQCGLLGLSRSTFYHTPKPESALNLELMRHMDEHYLLHPEKGVPRMHAWLTFDLHYKINIKRIERLYYEVMGLRAILPGPHTSKRHKDHAVYPYLLRGLQIDEPNQVWGMDITYVPMVSGFLYLVAIIDLYSRFLVHWSLSNTMDAQWCANTFNQAVEIWNYPKIINTDQGSQFTSDEFIQAVLDKNKTKLSMDGKGRAIDNVFIERFWRTIKYEYIYANPCNDGLQLFNGINSYITYYNQERRHQSLDYNTPYKIYVKK